MTQASQKIMQQYIDGGVIPAQLEGQAAVSKTYVDGQFALRDANINAAMGAAGAAQADIDSHEASSTAHPAQNITYFGKVTGAIDVKQAIDAVKTTLDQAMISGDSGPEALAARYSTPQNKTYSSLKDRLDASDVQLADIANNLNNNNAINVKYPPPPLVAAKGDGTTDDTAAIKGCLDRLNTDNRGQVYLPPGDYKINDEFRLYGNNQRISGAGMGVTKIIQYGANKGIFNFMDDWLKINITIDNLTLTADNYKNAECIKLLDAHNVHITKVSISKFKVGVYFADRCFDCYLHDFVISDVYDYGDAILIDVKPLGGGIFVSNGVVDCHRRPGTNCLRLISCSGSFFSDLDLRAAGGNSIYFNPIANGVIIYNWFTNVLADGSEGHGWIIDAPGTSLITGVFMTKCWSGTVAANGITIRGDGDIDGITITDHIAIDNGYDGLYIESGKNINIRGGTFAGNSQHASGQECGIRIKPGVSKFTINGVRSGQSIHRDKTQAFGIFVENGASNNYMITNCDLTDNTLSGLVDQGTGANKVVTNNLV